MAKKEKIYRRLRGKRKGLIGIQTLWRGPDHLLLIDSKRVAEDYKRFYYEDIQGLVVQKTYRGKILNLLAGAGLLALGLWAFHAGGPAGKTILGSLALLPLIGLLYNLFLGPTCTCSIMTAVQTEALPSLNRIRNAHKAIEQLRPRIDSVQGRLAQIPDTAGLQAPGKNHPAHPPSSASKNGYEKGAFHGLLFLLLLADAAAITSIYRGGHVIFTLLHMAIGLAMTMVAIIAIVKQHDSSMPKSLKAMTWSALIYIAANWIAGYAIYVAALIQHPQLLRSGNQWERLKYISSLSVRENSWHMGVYTAVFCFAIGLGISGLLLLLHYRRATRNWGDAAQGPPMMPPPLSSTV